MVGFGMGWIFLFLSLMKGAQNHETPGFQVVRVTEGDNRYFLLSALMIPYLLLVALFVIVFIPFFNAIRVETGNLFILSGVFSLPAL